MNIKIRIIGSNPLNPSFIPHLFYEIESGCQNLEIALVFLWPRVRYDKIGPFLDDIIVYSAEANIVGKYFKRL